MRFSPKKTVLLIRTSIRKFLLVGVWILSEKKNHNVHRAPTVPLLVLQRSWPNVAPPTLIEQLIPSSTLAYGQNTVNSFLCIYRIFSTQCFIVKRDRNQQKTFSNRHLKLILHISTSLSFSLSFMLVGTFTQSWFFQTQWLQAWLIV